MLKFKLNTQHEYEDSIHVEVMAEENVPGNGTQTVIAFSFFMTREQFDSLVEQGAEWFGYSKLIREAEENYNATMAAGIVRIAQG